MDSILINKHHKFDSRALSMGDMLIVATHPVSLTRSQMQLNQHSQACHAERQTVKRCSKAVEVIANTDPGVMSCADLMRPSCLVNIINNKFYLPFLDDHYKCCYLALHHPTN